MGVGGRRERGTFRGQGSRVPLVLGGGVRRSEWLWESHVEGGAGVVVTKAAGSASDRRGGAFPPLVCRL